MSERLCPDDWWGSLTAHLHDSSEAIGSVTPGQQAFQGQIVNVIRLLCYFCPVFVGGVKSEGLTWTKCPTPQSVGEKWLWEIKNLPVRWRWRQWPWAGSEKAPPACVLELMSLLVNGVRADFITSSRLLSLNKHLPVTSFTAPGAERPGRRGRGPGRSAPLDGQR